tara:strand:+ start:11069 stop:12343 length:1275 start_codon:yes stop_codon:yes gene_type:complete
MACSNVFDAFAIATENLADEVYRNASYRSVWLNAIPRGTFETGAGTVKTTFAIENSEPAADAETWTQIVNNDVIGGSTGGAGGSCASSFNDVEVGYTSRTYNPEEFALQGPILCKDDLIYDHNVDTFLRAYIEEMTKRAQRSWEKRYEELYMKFASKLSVGNGATIVDTESVITDVAFNSDGGVSTSTLTQQLLDQVAVELIDRGATNPDSNGFITYGEDGPVFPLLIGLEASQQIALNNADLRQDFRNAESGQGATAELMSRMGATRMIKNFRHVPNLRPPRFTYNTSTNKYVRVATYLMSAATKGKKAVLNPAYTTAPYEAAIVLNPNVYTSEIVPPVNAAGGVSWSPTSYMGEWKWVTGGNKIQTSGADCLDPLDKLGRHFAEFKHAPRPEFPNYGMTLIFKRACGTSGSVSITDVTACSS